ncbi:MAG: YraN family protein [Pseudomonadota bacterium]
MTEASKTRRRAAYCKGHRAELLALLTLILKGYRPVTRRARNAGGEIDLIVRRGTLIVFVEVKARATEGQALDAIGYEAQRRIEAAGELWIAQQPDASRLNWRFDVVAVQPWKWPAHFVDVW